MYSFLWFCAGALTMFVAVVAWFMWGLVEAGRDR
jgi:hypothetical protein